LTVDWTPSSSAQCEAAYCKALSRLQTQLMRNQQLGTFSPIWNLLRDLYERISAAHVSSTSLHQDILRDIHTYQDVFQKKVKTHIQKDPDICRTADLIVQFNNALTSLNKAKEQYHLLTLDYERSKRNGHPSSTSNENSSTSFFASRLNDRVEKKYRQAQEEYKQALERYNQVRNDYEKRFSEGKRQHLLVHHPHSNMFPRQI
jgi:hypothetical protein